MLFSSSDGSENTGTGICYSSQFSSFDNKIQRHTGYKAVASLDKFCKSAKVRPIGGGLLALPKEPLPPPLPPRPPLPKPRDIASANAGPMSQRKYRSESAKLKLRQYKTGWHAQHIRLFVSITIRSGNAFFFFFQATSFLIIMDKSLDEVSLAPLQRPLVGLTTAFQSPLDHRL